MVGQASKRLVPEICIFNGMGVDGGVMLAEKFKLSMPRPWALPVSSVICHPSHNAAPGGQLVMVRFEALRFFWLFGKVPFTATPPESAATVGMLTFSAGKNAVTPAGNVAVAVGSTK